MGDRSKGKVFVDTLRIAAALHSQAMVDNGRAATTGLNTEKRLGFGTFLWQTHCLRQRGGMNMDFILTPIDRHGSTDLCLTEVPVRYNIYIYVGAFFYRVCPLITWMRFAYVQNIELQVAHACRKRTRNFCASEVAISTAKA